MGIFTTNLIYMYLPSEYLEKLHEKDDIYQVFVLLPTFTYIIMGNIILLFIIELIV